MPPTTKRRTPPGIVWARALRRAGFNRRPLALSCPICAAPVIAYTVPGWPTPYIVDPHTTDAAGERAAIITGRPTHEHAPDTGAPTPRALDAIRDRPADNHPVWATHACRAELRRNAVTDRSFIPPPPKPLPDQSQMAPPF